MAKSKNPPPPPTDTSHPDAVVARILSHGDNDDSISRHDLAELSLVCGRLHGDLSSLMARLAPLVQRAVQVNLLQDVQNLYHHNNNNKSQHHQPSPSEVAKILDQVCWWSNDFLMF
jgi:hypothetical protein